MGVPPNHPFIDGIFPYKPTILGVLPLMESPIWQSWLKNDENLAIYMEPLLEKIEVFLYKRHRFGTAFVGHFPRVLVCRFSLVKPHLHVGLP